MRGDPVFEQPLVQSFPRGEPGPACKGRSSLRAQRNRGGAAGRQVRSKNPGQQMVFAIVQSPLPFLRQVIVAVPFLPRLRLKGIAQQINRRCSFARRHAKSSRNRRHRRLPFRSSCGSVDAPVIHQNFHFQFGWRRTINQVVANERGVGAVLHPHAFFQHRVRATKPPHRYGARQVKLLDVSKSLRFHGAARPTVRAQRVLVSRIAQRFLNPGEHQRPANFRKRSDQHPVIAPRLYPRHGSASEPAQPVRHQPLAFRGSAIGPANFRTEMNHDGRAHALTSGTVANL